jgi:hypothetical protein
MLWRAVRPREPRSPQKPTTTYLTSPRLRLVHWQPGEDRPVPEPAVTVAGESALFVDPSEIPASTDVAKLGQALAYLDGLYETLMNMRGRDMPGWLRVSSGDISTSEACLTGEKPMV